jgi:hypothetical protein
MSMVTRDRPEQLGSDTEMSSEAGWNRAGHGECTEAVATSGMSTCRDVQYLIRPCTILLSYSHSRQLPPWDEPNPL